MLIYASCKRSVWKSEQNNADKSDAVKIENNINLHKGTLIESHYKRL